MSHPLIPLLFASSLLVAMMLLFRAGEYLGNRELLRDPDHAKEGSGPVEAAILALLGLLIAFTFDGAAERFQIRRQLIISETNALSTAYRRFDLLEAGASEPLRGLLREYIDARLETYRVLGQGGDISAPRNAAEGLQQRMWSLALEGATRPGTSPAVAALLLPALNEAFDISTERLLFTRMHPPLVVFALLMVLCFASALLVGFGMAGGRSDRRLHKLGFAAVLSITVFLTLDLEYPRRGLIRVDAFDSALIDLRESLR